MAAKLLSNWAIFLWMPYFVRSRKHSNIDFFYWDKIFRLRLSHCYFVSLSRDINLKVYYNNPMALQRSEVSACQLTAGLTSMYLKTQVKDRSACIGVTCGQYVEASTFVDFLDEDYYYTLIATQIIWCWVGSHLIPGRKFLPTGDCTCELINLAKHPWKGKASCF